ncbi:hypothetical protein BDQ12DRAFT_718481 [Crucibulum laeve]|uniref:Uncharacterized protein n=1 Tax=Crucibulum laeve TaxID=68775 RepID=A0A5C3MFN9_9AGAR|nr:hypothetical protein BDQ12DRAFT_718481 [Crucibulum laeve]
MLWTPVCRSAQANVTQSLQNLLPKSLPPSLAKRPGNLYEVLSRTPTGGVGNRVYQLRWESKGIPDSYWEVTRTKFKCEGRHGKAWGVLYWKGRRVSEIEERIRGGLKYTWAEGRPRLPEANKNVRA